MELLSATNAEALEGALLAGIGIALQPDPSPGRRCVPAAWLPYSLAGARRRRRSMS